MVIKVYKQFLKQGDINLVNWIFLITYWKNCFGTISTINQKFYKLLFYKLPCSWTITAKRGIIKSEFGMRDLQQSVSRT